MLICSSMIFLYFQLMWVTTVTSRNSESDQMHAYSMCMTILKLYPVFNMSHSNHLAHKFRLMKFAHMVYKNVVPGLV